MLNNDVIFEDGYIRDVIGKHVIFGCWGLTKPIGDCYSKEFAERI